MENLRFKIFDKEMGGISEILPMEKFIDYMFDIKDLNKFVIIKSTNLFDKNNTEIFYGDIVKFRTSNIVRTAMIEFDGGMYCLKYRDGYINHYPLNPERYEIIGNIYQNKDLLQ